ncbi:MAG: class I SAM-dependent methyltransferase, partial [Thermodesulfobacteriota bacterium]|nr:class I SAM-dependent methyltransferase [Thermodesulfobacteriota bacterium]
MGLIFDINSARLYDSWRRSPQGKVMDKLVEESILTILDPKPGERVLDIGCGQGNHLIFFNRLRLDIHGLDASPYMINRARQRLGNRCSLKTGMAEDLPFDDNEFDLAILINTLEFLDDPLPALREAGRVAKNRVFIGVMNSLSWHCLHRKIQCIFRKSLFHSIRFYNLWEIKSYVQMAFGNVPIAWSCSQLWPSFMRRAAQQIVTSQLEQLGKYEKLEEPPSLEKILEAFY